MTSTRPELRLAAAALGSVLLTATALGAVFTSNDWVATTIAAVAVAFAAGALGRRLDVPTLLSPALSALGLVAFATAVFARDTAVLGVVPTGGTVDVLVEGMRSAGRDMRTLVAPVDVSTELRLVTAGGVYLVAVLVDLLVFRLARTSAVGLPLLALFIVPAALSPDGVGVVPFLLACTGYFVLLLADTRRRLSRWGRRLQYETDADGMPRLTTISRQARRLGGTALTVAVALPLLLPPLRGGVFFNGAGGGLRGRGGSSSAATYNPITHLKRDLVQDPARELMRVRTDRPAYLRLTSLERFDGYSWRQLTDLQAGEDQRVSRRGGLPAPFGLTAAERVQARADIEVSGLDVRWLPIAYAPQRVTVKGDWRYDERTLTVFSTRKTTRRLSYSVTSAIANPTREELATLPAEDFAIVGDASVALQGEVPPLLDFYLNRWTRDAATPYEKVLAIQENLRGPQFRYDTSIPQGNGLDDLTAFLTDRRGYCEQFAAVMAIMVRRLGLPARVAIGFTPGTLQRAGYYSVSNRDAHSWPEVFFPGAGWLPFEPTPRTDSTVRPPDYTLPAGAVDPAGEVPVPQPTADSGTAPPPGTRANQLENALERTVDADSDPNATFGVPGSSRGVLLWWLAALITLVALLLPAGMRAVYRTTAWRRAASDPRRLAHVAWALLRDDATDAGHPWPSSDTPRVAGRRLVATAGLRGAAAAAVSDLAAAEERARYAPRQLPTSALRAAVTAVRKEMLGACPPWRRALAVALPVSSIRRCAAWLERVANVVTERRQALGQSFVQRLPGPLRRALARA